MVSTRASVYHSEDSKHVSKVLTIQTENNAHDNDWHTVQTTT